MAVKGWDVGWPAAALVWTNKLPWEALGNVWELYLCLDLDVTGEGQKAARKLAREAVLRGVPVHMMEDGAYDGYSEPSDQWEAFLWRSVSLRRLLRVFPKEPSSSSTVPGCSICLCLCFRLWESLSI